MIRPAYLPIWLFSDNDDFTRDMCVLSKWKDSGIIGIMLLDSVAPELTVLFEDLECKVGSAD